MFGRLAAEFLGTFWLVLVGCGTALLAAGFREVGVGLTGVALAFGLALASAGYAFTPISGGHFNPAVTLGFAVAGRLAWSRVAGYAAAQTLGAAAGAGTLYLIAAGRADFTPGGFAANGFEALSPGSYHLPAVFLAEFVLTAFFVLFGLGARTSTRPAAMGLGLAAIYLATGPIDNGGINPARSLGSALFAQNGALGQVWLFVLAPLLGGGLGGLVSRLLPASDGGEA